MYSIRITSQLKKDSKKITKQGKDIQKLKTTLEILQAGNQLPSVYRDNYLSGNWKGYRECHIEPDWLLIYKIEAESLILLRTGSHSEIFE